jgi:hypothetical protein
MSAPSPPDSAEVIRLVSWAGNTARVRLGACATVVTLRASTVGLGGTIVTFSHRICTPEGEQSIKPRLFVGTPPRRALGAAIGELATRFQHGVSSGHIPMESWFVPGKALRAVSAGA